MEPAEQQKMLVDKVYSLTKESKLNWQIGANGEPYVFLGDFYVNLRQTRNANGADLYQVYIENKDVKEIDRFSDEDLDKTGTIYFKRLEMLHKIAMRQAAGADAAINAILGKLDSMK